jgi:hydroxypyruvate isomerase
MPKLAANLSTLFTELPFLDRYDAAAECGFSLVECQFPYVVTAQAIRERLDRLGLSQVLINAPQGDAAKGERGLAGVPGRQSDFRACILQALDYATVLGVPRVHVMAGIQPQGVPLADCIEVYVDNVSWAADQFAAAGIDVMLEPINTKVDVPGYVLHSTADAVDCIRRASRPNIRLQYDVYHMQIMEGDLARSIERLLPVIGHIQIADNPGRHEPGTGEIHFPWLLARLDALGYAGVVGCEYTPTGDTREGLAWARPWL